MNDVMMYIKIAVRLSKFEAIKITNIFLYKFVTLLAYRCLQDIYKIHTINLKPDSYQIMFFMSKATFELNHKNCI